MTIEESKAIIGQVIADKQKYIGGKVESYGNAFNNGKNQFGWENMIEYSQKNEPYFASKVKDIYQDAEDELMIVVTFENGSSAWFYVGDGCFQIEKNHINMFGHLNEYHKIYKKAK